jgi:hypothetical protein
VADPAYRLKLLEVGNRIVEGCSKELTPEEVSPLRSRLAELEKLATAPVDYLQPAQIDQAR